MRGRALGDPLAGALNDVLEAEASTAQVDTPRMDRQPVLEVRGPQVAGVRLEREGLDTLLPERRVPASESREVVDAGNLEPDQELGVVGDALCVRLGETNPDLGLEAEAVDAERLKCPSRQYTPASRPRSSGARAHRRPCQGSRAALARSSANSGLVLATEKCGSITCRGTQR
jgi:hypothetical protein